MRRRLFRVCNIRRRSLKFQGEPRPILIAIAATRAFAGYATTNRANRGTAGAETAAAATTVRDPNSRYWISRLACKLCTGITLLPSCECFQGREFGSTHTGLFAAIDGSSERCYNLFICGISDC